MDVFLISREDGDHRVAIPFSSIDYVELENGNLRIKTRSQAFVFSDALGYKFQETIDSLKEGSNKKEK